MNWPGTIPIAACESGFGATTTGPVPEYPGAPIMGGVQGVPYEVWGEPNQYEIVSPGQVEEPGLWDSLVAAFEGWGAPDVQYEYMDAPAPVATVAAVPKAGVPTWVWYAGAAAVAAFFIFRK